MEDSAKLHHLRRTRRPDTGKPFRPMVQTPVLRAGGAEEASNQVTKSTAHPLV